MYIRRIYQQRKSLPSRERGLKYRVSGDRRARGRRSLPSRERGLKLEGLRRFLPATPVAPLAGAWIEIFFVRGVFLRGAVAPLAGAWIEIFCNLATIIGISSRSPRGSVD